MIGRNHKHTKRNTDRGFSLVELIVVIVIIMILAGGLVLGVSKWVAYSHFSQQNEYAATLFLAAQNQLSEYDANGRLEEMGARLQGADGDYRPEILIPKINDGGREALNLIPATADTDAARVYLDELWPQSADKTNPQQYQSSVCFLRGTAKTYEAYQKYRAGQTLSAQEDAILSEDVKLLYEILLPYVYDQSILQAAVCLEFSPSDGQVFSLLYSNDGLNKQFTYDADDQYNQPGAPLYEGVASIMDRRVEAREKRSVGYYGVDTLSKVLTVTAAKPSLTNVDLHNEDTLNLSFRLKKYKDAIKLLTYNIDVYDKDTQKKRMEIVLKLPARIDMGQEDMEKADPVIGKVTRYSEAGEKLDTREYPFLVWLEEEYTIRLVLDAADESADAFSYDLTKNLLASDDFDSVLNNDVKRLYAEPFMKTFSFRRFGIDSDRIYCSVSAGGDIYSYSASKKSNDSYVYYEKQKDTTQGTVCQIANGRHLYNIRYSEVAHDVPEPAKGQLYQLTGDISWSDFAGKAMYCTAAQRDGSAESVRASLQEGEALYPFVTIRQLRKGCAFESDSSLLTAKQYTVSELTIQKEKNEAAQVYSFVNPDGTPDVSGEQKYVGLFAYNYGTIRNLQLDSVQVTGGNGVGAVCGANAGVLENISLNDSQKEVAGKKSVVTGDTQVGGIFGIEQATGETTVYKNLTNYARIRGRQSIGGITGRLVATNTHGIRLEQCKNYGAIEGTERTDGQTATAYDIRYLGGIAGLCLNFSDAEKLVLDGCISSPQDEEVLRLVPDFSSANNGEVQEWEIALAKKMKGVYVGGITGYNQGGVLTDCHTRNNKNTQGYVLGDTYVGGIVGYNAGVAGHLLNGNENGNEANVLGNTYVGGIVGCNGSLQTPIVFETDGSDNIGLQDEIPQAAPDRDDQKQIANWVNRGVVCAKTNYAGGIAGYNAGQLENCRSEVKADNVAQKITSASSMQGSYIGGIAGYNNGMIQSGMAGSARREISTVSYVNGKDYVGGIVGYNDLNAGIDGYKLSGGYIQGSGNFIGGYVGLNVSRDLISGQALYSNPNRVTGKYFVGGNIGGNILVMQESESDISVQLNTDNFLGYVQAEAFVGGFIGYNHLMKEAGDASQVAAQISELTETTYEELPASYRQDESTDDQKQKKVLAYLVNELEGRQWQGCESTDKRLTIQALTDGENQQNKFGGIIAKVYVGGVIGFNHPESALTLRNVENKTRVTATTAIVNPQEMADGDAKYREFKYSYAGGVVGKAGKKVIVDHCNNADAGDVVSVGTYLGGVCELNEGLVTNCQASNIGVTSKSYVGGIVGLNKKGGRIENISMVNNTITGDSYVGGIVSENYGTVKNVTIKNGTVNASGMYIGGVAGVNYGEIVMAELSAVTGELSVDNAKVIIQGNGTYVGGLVGKNVNRLTGVEQDTVTALTRAYTMKDGNIHGLQYVGGVVGINARELSGTGNLEISGFCNASSVNALNGEVGGIVGKSESDITYCENRGEIVAMKTGNAGGIVAHNSATVAHCVNKGAVTASNGNCGGITGENLETGIIDTCEVCGTAQNSLLFEGLTNVGGVCAKNEGMIKDTSLSYVTASDTSKSKASNIGLYTGLNYGKISFTAKAGKSAVQNCLVQTYTNGSYVGGIAGINASRTQGGEQVGGEITGLTIADSRVILAGFNENAPAVEQFMQCKATYSNMGGIAGYNQAGAQIKNCVAGISIYGDMSEQGSAYGGVTALNEGTIKGTDFNGNLYGNGSASKVVIIGGIAGKNLESGLIEECCIGTTDPGEQGYRIMSGYTVSLITPNESKWGEAMKESSGLVGGIAAESNGVIRNCDNAKSSVAKVTIQNGAGSVGGIVAHLYSGAVVTGTAPAQEGDEPKYLSTGKKWKVKSWAYSNNSGASGIIGYTVSGEDVRYVINYANAASSANQKNAAAGGIIGRAENNTRPNMIIEHVTNYGTIEGSFVGGIVGRTKYMPMEIRNCINYGDCSSTCDPANTGQACAAGILATVHMVADYPTYVEDCMNFGAIQGKVGQAAGIFSMTSESEVVISNCVNLGEINASGSKVVSVGGIAAISGNSTGSKVSVYNCRNYANSKSQYFAGIGATLNNAKTGVVAPMTISNCFSIGQGGTGDSSPKKAVETITTNVSNAYALKSREELSQDAKVVYLKANTAPSLTTAKVVENGLYDMLNYDVKPGEKTNRYILQMTSANTAAVRGTVKFQFKNTELLSGIGVKFANDNASNFEDRRIYQFKISVTAVVDKKDVELWLKESKGECAFVNGEADATIFTVTTDKNAGDNNWFKAKFEDGTEKSIKAFKIQIIKIADNDIANVKNNLHIDHLSVTQENIEKKVLVPDAGAELVTEQTEDGKGYRIVRADEYAANQGLEQKQYTTYIDGLQLNPETVWGDFGTLHDTSDREKSDRYAVYQELDEKVMQFMRDNATGSAKPKNLKYTIEDGVIHFTWTHEVGIYYQDMLVYRSESATNPKEWSEPVYIPMGVCSYRLTIEPEWYGKRFDVAVCSTNGQFTTVTSIADSNFLSTPKQLTNASGWVNIKNGFLVNPRMPVPKYHLELGAYDADGNIDYMKYVAILDNPEEFQGDHATTIEIIGREGTNEKGKWYIDTAVSDRSASNYLPVYNNVRISAQALANDKFSNSVKTQVEYANVGTTSSNNLKNKVLIKTTFDSFFGDRSSALYYQMKLKSGSGSNVVPDQYENLEVVALEYPIGKTAGGDEVKADLVVSKGVSHVTTLGDGLTSVLTDMPKDILNHQNILVRNYTWKSQADILYFGHYVKQNIAKEDLVNTLFTLVDTERYDAEHPAGMPVYIWDESNAEGQLRDGYVLSLNEDGTYDIFYDVLLDKQGEDTKPFAKQVIETLYTVDRSANPGRVTATVNGKAYNVPIRPQPVILPDNPLNEENDSDYTFTWDRGMTDTTAVYDLMLYGYAKDGTEVLLEQTTVDAGRGYHSEDGGYWQIVFQDKGATWDYPRYRLTVERVGAISASGQTTCFPAYAEQNYSVKERLSQIARPTVDLLQNDGRVDKNSLIYSAVWTGVPVEEEPYVSAYEIWVRPRGEGRESTYATLEEYQDTLAELMAYYAAKTDVVVTDQSDQGAMIYTWTESGSLNNEAYSVQKEVTISYNQDDLKIVSALSERWYYDAQKTARPMDLNDYDRGMQLQVSIRAMAQAGDECPYRDGPAGVERDVTLPERLFVPDVSALTGMPEYEADGYTSQEDFTNSGFVLQMRDDTADAVQGKYQIAIAIEETDAQKNAIAKMKAGDSTDQAEGYWNSAVEETIFTKASGKEMIGDFLSSQTEVKGLPARYAGMWMKVALRAISDNNISSWWTDEDETLERTVNYAYLRLPRVRLALPEAGRDTVTQVFYDVDGNYSLETLAESSTIRRSDQTTISFALDELADLYRIERLRTAQDTADGRSVQGDWIYLQKAQDGSYLVYAKTSQKPLEDASGQERPAYDADAVYLGTLPAEGGTLCMPFDETVKIAASGERERSVMFLQVDTGKQECRLILPDTEAMSTEYVDTAHENLLTAQISIQALALEEHTERFADSAIASWYRSENSGNWTTQTASFEEKAKTQVPDAVIAMSEQKDIAYELKVTAGSNLLYLAELGNAEGTAVYDRRILSVCEDLQDPSGRVWYLTDAYIEELIAKGYQPGSENILKLRAVTASVPGAGFDEPAAEQTLTVPALQLSEIAVKTVELETPVNLTYEEDGETATVATQANQYSFALEENVKRKGYRIHFLVNAIDGTQDVTLTIVNRDGKWYLGDTGLGIGKEVAAGTLTGTRLEVRDPAIGSVTGNDNDVAAETLTAQIFIKRVRNKDARERLQIVVPRGIVELRDPVSGKVTFKYDFYAGVKVHQIPAKDYYGSK